VKELENIQVVVIMGYLREKGKYLRYLFKIFIPQTITKASFYGLRKIKRCTGGR
jgi:CTP:phosphocholine cytidylyltransferase-like protein